jgi:uncharacterized protein DUF3224
MTRADGTMARERDPRGLAIDVSDRALGSLAEATLGEATLGDERRAVARFDVVDWQTSCADDDRAPGPQLYRVRVQKAFRGDIEGESRGEMLMCIAESDDLEGEGGYVVCERVTARLDGRSGTFVLQHWGVSAGCDVETGAGHIVPGSGTGELAGIAGMVEITADAGSGHTIALAYRLPDR